MIKTRRQGAVMVLFLGLMTIGLLFAVASLSYQGMVYRNSKQLSSKQDATYLAEAGLEKGLSAFLSNPSYTGETLTLGNGSTVVTLSSGATANEKIVSAIATVNGQVRRLRTKITTQASGVAVAFRYALQAGNLGLTMGNGSVIVGNLYSNQNITASNGSSITGDAYAVGTISNALTVSGQKRTGQPTQPMPVFDAPFWQTRAQTGTNITGNYTPPNNSTIGPLFVNGNITFTNGDSITIRGPVYATGTVTFGNNITLTIDQSLGTDGAMIVADGTISFGNSLQVIRPNNVGYVLIISNSTSDTAINIANGTTISYAPLLTPNGGISIGNSSQAVAFAGRYVRLFNNAVVNYDQGLASASFTIGPSGTWTVRKGTYQEF